jgi:CTD small phosphatase-like protein 2
MTGKILRAGFNIRPYTRECLEMVNKDFEVVVFTASHKWYADVILDYIDPERKLIQHRLYRDRCIKTTDNVYIKDLRVFKNRDMKDMILVDNAVYSFGAQLSNGIPITPFKDDKDDREFICLMNYIRMIKEVDDFRVANREAFKMEQVYQFNLEKFIHYYDYDQCNEKSDEEYSETDENDRP